MECFNKDCHYHYFGIAGNCDKMEESDLDDCLDYQSREPIKNDRFGLCDYGIKGVIKMDTNELRKAATAVFLVIDVAVAQDLSDKLRNAANEIDQLRKEVANKSTHPPSG